MKVKFSVCLRSSKSKSKYIVLCHYEPARPALFFSRSVGPWPVGAGVWRRRGWPSPRPSPIDGRGAIHAGRGVT